MSPPPLPSDENPPVLDAAGALAHDLPQAPHEPAALEPSAQELAARASRDVIALTWPVVLGQIMANAVPLIDILMLGRLGTPTLAAVGYASQFLMLAQASLLAIGSASVALMARAIGAKDVVRARQAWSASLALALGVTTLLTAITLLFPRQLLHVLAVKDSVIQLAIPYFRLTMTSSLLMAVALSYEHAFRSAKNTLAPMLIAAIVSIAKVGCNYLLIFGELGLPRLGLAGAGVATILSQALAVGLFVAASRRASHPALRLELRDLRIERSMLDETYAIALPAVGERMIMTAAMMAYFRFLGNYGVEAVAAYNVGVRILAFTWIPGIGLSVAAATLVGHALGAGEPRLARRAGWEAVRIGTLLSIVLGALFVALRIPMAKIFTQDPKVIADLDPFILLLGLALPFLVAHFTLGGALRGAGDTLTPLKAALLGNWLFRVPLGYLFGQALGLDLFWVWAIMLIDHVSRAAWLVWAFHFGQWDRKVGTRVRDDVGRTPLLRAG